MNYSIIKVEGISMKPFMQSADLIVVRQLIPGEIIEIGSCIYQNSLVHRLGNNGQLKGDRILYYDQFPIDLSNAYLVIGRVLKKTPRLVVSHHRNIWLSFLSTNISKLSKYNTEKNYLRVFILGLIIATSSLHRFLENFFLTPNSPEVK